MNNQFQFGPFLLDARERRLARDGQAIHLQPRAFDVLRVLLENAGQLLTKQDVMDAVWGQVIVTENSLTTCIRQVRAALQDNAEAPDFIETVPGSGYRFIALVQVPDDEAAAREHPARRWLPVAALLALVAAYGALHRWGGDDARSGVADGRQWDRSIAVLPFVNMSEDAANDYFAEGIAEEILNLMGRIPRLKVIGRTSSFSFRGQATDLREIGRILGVETVLEGSVRKSGGRVRIAAQLINTADGSLIWSDSYDREVSEIFHLQDEVAAAIIGALRLESGALPSRGQPTRDQRAYALFLKARNAIARYDGLEARNLLLQALERDPEFGDAWELLAYTYWVLAGSENAVRSQELVHDAASRAVAIDPELVFAGIYLRTTQLGPQYRSGTIAALDKAILEHPDNPQLLEALIFLLIECGYLRESLALSERFVAVDPVSVIAHQYRAFALFALGRRAEAELALQVIDEPTPVLNYWSWMVQGFYLAAGQDERAIVTMDHWLSASGRDVSVTFSELVPRVRQAPDPRAVLDRYTPSLREQLPPEASFNWPEELTGLYLYFGLLDRYYEMVFATEPTDQTWHYAGIHVFRGMVFNQLGFTGHPDFPRLAAMLSIDDVWEVRGPPDMCRQENLAWRCQ